MILQERDKQIIDLIKKFHAVTTSQIASAYFRNDYLCQRRLRILYQAKFIKRCRDNINIDYVYYTDKKTAKMQHYITLAGLYVSMLHMPVKIIAFDVEKEIGNVIPDAFIQYATGGYLYSYFAEVHLSNNEFNQDKYEELYRSRKWLTNGMKVFPRILIVTDKKVLIEPTLLKYIPLPINYEGIEKMLK